MARVPALVVFFGGAGPSPIEHAVDGARLAASIDAIEIARAAGIDKVILVTDEPGLAVDGVEIDCSGEPHHFGHRLVDVVRKHGLESVIYMGGGSLPLFTAQDFDFVVETLATGAAVTNNHFSSDLIALHCTDAALAKTAGVTRDNALARSLKEAGIETESLPRNLRTQMDIDSPSDLLVLALTDEGGPRLRQYLADLALDTSRYAATLTFFADRSAEVLVAGRVGSHAWRYLERETACRVRLFAEERGMEADGRVDAGNAKSLLGFYLDSVGIDHFFASLTELGNAAFIDTRVLLAHRQISASREDRFLSDAGQWKAVSEPFLREFTQKAAEAPMPVLLGGHSLMSGGLMALNEHAWALSER